MSILAAVLLAGLCVASAAEERAEPEISMEWEDIPEPGPPNAWIGIGASLASDALVYGGEPFGAGLDLRWVPRQRGFVVRFTHRTWRSPSEGFESELGAQGVTEGVQNFWAGRMRLGMHYRFVTPGDNKARGGFQLGPTVLRTQHVGKKAQLYLEREHDLQWGPRWTFAAGPEFHMGVFGDDEAFQVTAFGRYHAPFAARLNEAKEGIILDGHLYDPVETIQREADMGALFGVRADPFYIQLELASRVYGPSRYDRVHQRLWWRGMLAGDLSVGVAL
jgi:hypothetical protein